MPNWPANVEIRPTGINWIGRWRGGVDGLEIGGRIWKSALLDWGDMEAEWYGRVEE